MLFQHFDSKVDGDRVRVSFRCFRLSRGRLRRFIWNHIGIVEVRTSETELSWAAMVVSVRADLCGRICGDIQRFVDSGVNLALIEP